jgi:GR25 family glycosyltransferase involved in LPS biosynthesis
VVISLPRRQDRRGLLTIPFDHEFFDALDGHRIPMREGWESGRGAHGCCLSHCHVLARALSDGVQTLFVMEDDVVFAPNFLAQFRLLLRRLPSDWEGLLLGGQHATAPVPVCQKVVRVVRSYRTHAYLARPPFQRALYEAWSRCRQHIDSHGWHGTLDRCKVYAPTSWLCGQSAGYSDIGCRVNSEAAWQ